MISALEGSEGALELVTRYDLGCFVTRIRAHEPIRCILLKSHLADAFAADDDTALDIKGHLGGSVSCTLTWNSEMMKCKDRLKYNLYDYREGLELAAH